MAMIDRDLTRAINSGRCFALVGSGPSSEEGLPSWASLAENAMKAMPEGLARDQANGLLQQKRLLEVFQLAQSIVGRTDLLHVVQQAMTGHPLDGIVYRHLASWPFRCYITTNFDDEIQRHLRNAGLTFVAKRNSASDMALIHAEATDIIFKIHGDPSVPDDMVLTRGDYDKFRSSPDRAYWRDSILSLFKMVDLVAIGYSFRDPDIQDQLEKFKIIASPNHPIFLIAKDAPPEQMRELYEHNIRVISYPDADGTHKELARLLKRYDPFIAKRGTSAIGLPPIDSEAAATAASLYTFSSLRLKEDRTVAKKAHAALLMSSLINLTKTRPTVDMITLANEAARKIGSASLDPVAVQDSMSYLHASGYVNLEGGMISATPSGEWTWARASAERQLAEQKFEEFSRSYLANHFPQIDSKGVANIISQLKGGVIEAFAKRGLEIARWAFADRALDFSDALDVLDMINGRCGWLASEKEKAAFCDLVLEVFLNPSGAPRAFLGLMAQGYFAYHALGLDPKCSDERINLAKKVSWILDSHVILPILALECMNYGTAKDLLTRMLALGLSCCTTPKLYEEVRVHLVWFINFTSNTPGHSPAMLLVS